MLAYIILLVMKNDQKKSDEQKKSRYQFLEIVGIVDDMRAGIRKLKQNERMRIFIGNNFEEYFTENPMRIYAESGPFIIHQYITAI